MFTHMGSNLEILGAHIAIDPQRAGTELSRFNLVNIMVACPGNVSPTSGENNNACKGG